MIIMESESMSMVTIGAHDITNRRSQENSVWKSIEEAAHELDSWIAEQGNIPLLIGYGDTGKRNQRMVTQTSVGMITRAEAKVGIDEEVGARTGSPAVTGTGIVEQAMEHWIRGSNKSRRHRYKGNMGMQTAEEE
jgi:hypothetical protein